MQDLFKQLEIFEKEVRYGKQLYIIAWGVEIIAVGLGLFIAVSIAYDAYSTYPTPTTSQTLNATIGALPFFAIAIVELTKIPLAGGFIK